VSQHFKPHGKPEQQDSVEQWLSKIFDRALRGGILTGLLAQGCASDRATAMEEPSDTEPAAEAQAAIQNGGVYCAEGVNSPISARGLRPARRYDYLAVRHVTDFGSAEGDESWTRTNFEVVSEAGVACATATTPMCHRKVAHHPQSLQPTSCLQICSETSVVTTVGNEVRRWTGLDELRALLAPIDTPHEALLLVEAAGYDLACNDPERTSVRAAGNGYVVTATKLTAICAPIITTRYSLYVSRSGVIHELASEELSRDEFACIGRVPEGLSSAPRDRGSSALGDWLSRCAHLEAASVAAFERLAHELEALGAPASLLAEAQRAAKDEVRHAKVVGALARARGGEPVAARVTPLGSRSLEAVALENAVEGCARETFGALVGAYQAKHAEDPEIAAAMREIAADEARHAALSWKVHAWAMERLSPEKQAHIQRAQEEALSGLAAGASRQHEPAMMRAAGLPSPEQAACLLDTLRRGLMGSA